MTASLVSGEVGPNLDHALPHWRWRLGFERDLESQFVREAAAARLGHFVVSGWFSLFAFQVFIVSDGLMLPDVFRMAAMLRLLASVPMAIVLWSLSCHTQAWLARPYAWTEWVMTFQGMLFSCIMTILLLCSHSPTCYFYHAGYALTLMMGTIAHRLRFTHALSLAAFSLASHMLVLLARPDTPTPLCGSLLVLNGAMAFYMLVGNHRMEFEERRRFMLGHAEQRLLNELAQTHLRLEAVSQTDALTAVANRRRFDDYFRHQWNRTRLSGEPLSLLLMDVDHFKAFNDRYGHPTGDECLRCVAQELQRQLEARQGLLARWGGEEFAVVLPAASATTAQAVAERLRSAVQALALRHEASPTASMVTISVGVATLVPAQCMDFPQVLVARADAGLYLAKREGRNRVAADSPQA